MQHLPTMTESEARDAGLFTVPESSMEAAESAFAKLAKRARGRLGSDAPALEWVARGMWQHTWEIDNGDGERLSRSRMVPCYFARIVGNAPKLAGWELAARLVLTATGERQINAVQGMALPARFRDTGVECDHCHMDRARRDVFVVHNVETGEYKQVGRTCLADFLGHDPARLLLAFVSSGMIRDAFESELAGGFGQVTRDTVETLEYAAAVIRLEGWHSRGTAQSTGATATADVVATCLGGGETAARFRRFYAPSPSDSKLAMDSLEWVRGTLSQKDDTSDYEHNLIISVRHSEIDARSIGVAVSAVSAYLRALSREAELQAKRASNAASQYVGTVGERVRNVVATVELKKLCESDFGSSYLVKLRTAEGNLLSWFCSGRGADDVRPGESVRITGTVKAHKEWNGAKETQLSRCKIESESLPSSGRPANGWVGVAA